MAARPRATITSDTRRNVADGPSSGNAAIWRSWPNRTSDATCEPTNNMTVSETRRATRSVVLRRTRDGNVICVKLSPGLLGEVMPRHSDTRIAPTRSSIRHARIRARGTPLDPRLRPFVPNVSEITQVTTVRVPMMSAESCAPFEEAPDAAEERDPMNRTRVAPATILLLAGLVIALTSQVAFAATVPVVTMSPGNTDIQSNVWQAVDAGLTVTGDAGISLTGASIRIEGFKAGENLACTTPGLLVTNWDAVTGTLTLTGASTTAQYTTALRSVQYDGSAVNYMRAIDFVVNSKDAGSSAVATKTLLRNRPPELLNDGYIYYSTKSGTPLTVSAADGVLSIASDPDGDPLVAAYQYFLGGLDYGRNAATVNPDGSFTYSPDLAYTGLDFFAFRVFDGHAYVEGYAIIDVISAKPETQAFGTAIDNGPEIITKDATVTLTAQAFGQANIDTTYYRIDSGIEQIYTGPFALTDGQHSLFYWSVDTRGRIESPKEAPYWVDSTPPTTTSDAPTAWVFGPVDVTLTATDPGGLAGAGVDTTYFSVGAGDVATGTVVPTISTEGDHVISFWSTDLLGNTETPKTAHVKIDQSPPTVGDDASTGWSTTSPVRVHLTSTDLLSGPRDAHYSTDGSNPSTNYGSYVSFGNEGTTPLKYK